jgi:hypothetical protein
MQGQGIKLSTLFALATSINLCRPAIKSESGQSPYIHRIRASICVIIINYYNNIVNSEITTRMDTYARFLYQLQMKKIWLLTSAEDTVLCELKCGMDISSNTLCAIKGKKSSTHTSHTIQQIFMAKGKGPGINLYLGEGLLSRFIP